MNTFKEHLIQELAVQIDYKSLIQKLRSFKYTLSYVKKNVIENPAVGRYKRDTKSNTFLRPENRSQHKMRLGIGNKEINNEIAKKIDDIKNAPYLTFDEYEDENPSHRNYAWDMEKRKKVYKVDMSSEKYRRDNEIKKLLKRKKTYETDHRSDRIQDLKAYYDVKATKTTIKGLDKVFKKSKSLDPIILYRVVGYSGTGQGRRFEGDHKDIFDRKIKQSMNKESVSTYMDLAYMSCTYNKKLIKRSITSGAVVLMILCPKPYKGVFPDIDDPEKEVILPRKSKFLINAINDEEEKKDLGIRSSDLIIMTMVSQKL